MAQQYTVPVQQNPMNMAQGMPGGSPLMTGYAYGGMANTPGFQPVYDPYTMNMTPQVAGQLNAIDLSGLNNSVDAFRGMAMRKGASPWAQMAGNQQNALMSNELERGQNQTGAAKAQALGELAQNGGLSSGARERVSEAGQKNLMNMTQDAGRQNSLNQLQIGVNDQQNKMQQMGMLPGMEAQALAPQFQKESIWQNAADQNTQRAIAENQYANQWNQNLYNQQMQAWGAKQQADATMASGK